MCYLHHVINMEKCSFTPLVFTPQERQAPVTRSTVFKRDLPHFLKDKHSLQRGNLLHPKTAWLIYTANNPHRDAFIPFNYNYTFIKNIVLLYPVYSSNQMHFAYTRNRHLGLSVNGSVRAPRDQVTHALHDF